MIPTLLFVGLVFGMAAGWSRLLVASMVVTSVVWGIALAVWADVDGVVGVLGAAGLGLVNVAIGAFVGLGLRGLVGARRGRRSTAA